MWLLQLRLSGETTAGTGDPFHEKNGYGKQKEKIRGGCEIWESYYMYPHRRIFVQK